MKSHTARNIAFLFVFILLFAITIRAAVADVAVPSVVSFEPTGADRNTTVTASFVITNNDANSSINDTVVSATASSKYNLEFSLDNTTFSGTVTVVTLGAAQNTTIYTRATVPLTEQSGSHDIADITLTNAQQTATIATVLMDPVSKLQITDIDFDGDTLDQGDTVDIKPDTTVNIDIEVKNLFNDDTDIEDIEVEMTIFDIKSGNRDLTKDSNKFDLDGDEDDTVTLTVSIPDELDDDSYAIEFLVEGFDENGARHTAQLTGTLNVDKEDHELRLIADLSADELSCSRTTSVHIIVKNLGSNDEDDSRIEVRSGALGIFEDIRRDIDENEQFRTDISLNLDNAREGNYIITVDVFNEDEDLEDSSSLSLAIRDCATQTTPDELDAITKMHQKLLASLITPQPVDQPSAEEDKDDGEGISLWVWFGLFDLLAIAVIVALVVSKKNKAQTHKKGSNGKKNGNSKLPAQTVLEMRKLKKKTSKKNKK